MLVMNPAARHHQRWLVAVLATCLVLAQALWLLHRVAHFDVATHAVLAHGSHASEAGFARHSTSPVAQALLPDHQDQRSCAQYDHLSHADMAPGCELMDATQAHAFLAQATHAASQMATQAAGFLARGPPPAIA
jgi:hypothetical protein